MADAEEPRVESDRKDMSEADVSTDPVVAETEADEGNVFDNALVALVADTKAVPAASASLATGVSCDEEHDQLSHLLNSEAPATMPDRAASDPDAGSESDADDDGHTLNDYEQEHEKLWSSDDDEVHDPDSAVAYTTESATTAGSGAPPLVASHASTLRETQTRLRRQEVRHHIEQPVTASLYAHHFSVANTRSPSSVGVWLLHQHALLLLVDALRCGRPSPPPALLLEK